VATDELAFGDDVPASYVEFVDEMLSATPFGVVAEFFSNFAALDKFETVKALSVVPTSSICGTADRITSIGHSRKLHAYITGSNLLECEGAGHLVIMERHDDVNAELVPRQCLRVALAEHAKRRAVDADRVALDLDTGKPAVRRVVVEQVREDVRRRKVVHGDDVELAAALQVRSNEVPPDPAEAVDSNLECHPGASLVTASRRASRRVHIARTKCGALCPEWAGRGESSEDDPSPRFAALRTAMTDGV